MNRFISLFILLLSSASLWAQPGIRPLKIKDGQLPVEQLQPLVSEMAKHSIVGLGEGTHGTKEWNDTRIAIIKELVAKNGFRVLCFENAFGDTYYFNQWLNSNKPVREGMKQYLIALWQTRELEGLFEWVRRFNRQHADKITIAGMDFNYLGNTAALLREQAKPLQHPLLEQWTQELQLTAQTFDSIWNCQMKGVGRKDFISVITHGTSKLHQVDSLVKTDTLPVSETFQRALLNGLCWTSGEDNRDSGMANMAVSIAGNSKMIVWAHAVHLALRSPFNDHAVGGCGGYIKKKVPAYYALGTGMSAGTYGGTADRFDTKQNVMQAYALPAVTAPSWDSLFHQQALPAFYIDLHKASADTTLRPLRLVGYGPPASISYSDPVRLKDLFDGYLFLEYTSAPDYLP
ncbi:erythromycin esterase family protein [Chitinophaga oryzae]|uniref:Erythromycin esterase family protein n=1 Tax=Chitinophaga oryzae TaxID=2725414 RepID=A0AAE6ZDS3_9BACT|nr:erythromycin esterase family protein [Chitinophaga oryzae]QJB30175.1 erythromycin esterase family protein [Chitinophaga oryzae]QJB36679.1 erythromycin esterase family protein [Chitinophaga oryzae]